MSRNANMTGLALRSHATAARPRLRTSMRASKCASVATGSITIEVVDTPDGFDRLRGEWIVLGRGAPAHAVFQTFDWCNAWYRRYAAGPDGVRLHVIVGRRDGRAALIWPLMATRHAGVWILKWLSDPFAQYGDVLLDPAEPAGPWIEAAWSALAHDPSVDGISLRHIRTDAALHGFLSARCGAPVAKDAAPFLDMTQFDGLEAYHSTLSRNQRASRSKLRKKLERQGDVAFAVHREGPDFDKAVAVALGFKRQWLATHGYRADVLLEPGLEDFLRDLGRGGDTGGVTAAAGVLTRNGTALSVDLGIHFKGEYFGYLIVQDQSLLDQSPAKLHLDLLQRWTVEHGFTRFDLMVPNAPYKMHWSNGAMQVDDFAFATSAKGHLYRDLYLKTLRPRMKRLYYALPVSLRRLLVGLLRAGRAKTG